MVDILFPVDVSLTVCGGWTILVGQIIVIAANLSGAFPSRIIVADGVLTDAPCLGFVALGINALDAVRKLLAILNPLDGIGDLVNLLLGERCVGHNG